MSKGMEEQISDMFTKYIESIAQLTKDAQTDNDKDITKPLLTIEVSDLNSEPVVKYKGEEVDWKVSVKYEWETRTDVEGKHSFSIKRYEGDDTVTTTHELEG